MSEQNRSRFPENNLQKWIKVLAVVCIMFVLVGFAVGIIGSGYFDLSDPTGIEAFGNFASGTVVALWSLSGVVLIFIAFLGQRLELLYQKEDLKLNRRELEETRRVLNDQKAEFQQQNKMLSKQNFESLFFQLLRNHTEILYHMDVGNSNDKKSGRDCFPFLYEEFRSSYGSLNETADEPAKIKLSYKKFYGSYQNDLGSYFRNLYHIIKFVKNSDIEEKKTYTNIVRAQLSTFELALLFYNCLSDNGNRKFKPLVEEYNLVKNLPKEVLLMQDHAKLYTNIVFEEDERLL